MAAAQLFTPLSSHATLYELKRVAPGLLVSIVGDPAAPATPVVPATPATAPIAALSTSLLAFGSINVGQTTAAQAVLLTNTGDATLALTTAPTVSGGAFSASSNCGTSLAPSASCSTSVQFAPGTTGPLTGSLSFATNAAGSPSVVSLTGTGTPAPTFALTQTLVDFGKAAVGTVPAYRRVTVTNTGAVSLLAPVVRGSGSGFLAHYTCSGTLAPAATCYFDFEFDPLAVQAYVGGLTLAYTGTSTQSIVINGSGVASPTLTSAALALASSATGVAAPAQTFTVTNTSDYSLTVSAKALTGTNAGDFSVSGCATALAAGSSCVVTVGFTPSGTAVESATLTLTHNGSGGTSTVALSGSNTGTVDAAYSSVSLLMHGDGVAGSTALIDSSVSPKTVTAAGNTQLSSGASKFGGSSIYFDGAGDYGTVAANAAFQLGSADFTVETWVRFDTVPGYYAHIAGMGNGVLPSSYALAVNNSKFAWSVRMAGTTTPLANTWYHVAVTRASGTLRLFVNGVQEATMPDATGYTGNYPFTVGDRATGDANGLYPMKGYQDEIRVTKGVARYTGNFSVPTSAFANQ